MNLWLDDLRPAPKGWTHVTTVKDAINLLQKNEIEEMSLDHDLGACDECMKKAGANSPQQWLETHNFESMPHCPHVGTGLQFVLWMAVNNIWPKNIPQVHSANPAGAMRMREDIFRHFKRKD